MNLNNMAHAVGLEDFKKLLQSLCDRYTKKYQKASRLLSILPTAPYRNDTPIDLSLDYDTQVRFLRKFHKWGNRYCEWNGVMRLQETQSTPYTTVDLLTNKRMFLDASVDCMINSLFNLYEQFMITGAQRSNTGNELAEYTLRPDYTIAGLEWLVISNGVFPNDIVTDIHTRGMINIPQDWIILTHPTNIGYIYTYIEDHTIEKRCLLNWNMPKDRSYIFNPKSIMQVYQTYPTVLVNNDEQNFTFRISMNVSVEYSLNICNEFGVMRHAL